MAYSFGSTTADRVRYVPLSANIWSSLSTCQVLGGWFLPTALTAGRYFFSYGGTNAGTSGMSVHSTTSELLLKHGRTTSARTWSTSGANIAVGDWRFLAMMMVNASSNAGTAVAACFVGDGHSLDEVPLTLVAAGSGNSFSGGNLNIGNEGIASPVLSFEGLVGIFSAALMPVSGLPSYPTQGIVIGNPPTVPQSSIDFVKNFVAFPMMRGQPFHRMWDFRPHVVSMGVHVSFAGPLGFATTHGLVYATTSQVLRVSSAPTIGGTPTYVEDAPPVPFLLHSPYSDQPLMRRRRL